MLALGLSFHEDFYPGTLFKLNKTLGKGSFCGGQKENKVGKFYWPYFKYDSLEELVHALYDLIRERDFEALPVVVNDLEYISQSNYKFSTERMSGIKLGDLVSILNDSTGQISGKPTPSQISGWGGTKISSATGKNYDPIPSAILALLIQGRIIPSLLLALGELVSSNIDEIKFYGSWKSENSDEDNFYSWSYDIDVDGLQADKSHIPYVRVLFKPQFLKLLGTTSFFSYGREFAPNEYHSLKDGYVLDVHIPDLSLDEIYKVLVGDCIGSLGNQAYQHIYSSEGYAKLGFKFETTELLSRALFSLLYEPALDKMAFKVLSFKDSYIDVCMETSLSTLRASMEPEDMVDKWTTPFTFSFGQKIKSMVAGSLVTRLYDFATNSMFFGSTIDLNFSIARMARISLANL